MQEFYSKVVGVTAKNTNDTDRQDYIQRYCKKGKELSLKREPNNTYDSNAIAVFIKTKIFFIKSAKFQIGYISADIAQRLAPYIDKGGIVTSSIKDVTGGSDKKSYGVNILIKKNK
jgi:predicted enzyme related to lactoylglutathione lyase